MENAKMDAMAADELRKLAEEKTQRIAELEGELLDAEALRRQMFNQIQELRGNVRVFCRVRPTGNDAATPCVETMPDTTSVSLQLGPKKSSAFSFDRAFGPESTQDEVFGEVSGLVQSALDGYKVCLFSYGQTGSGKTHTMLGGSDEASRGIIPRAVEKVVEASKLNEIKGWSYKMTASYVEIYNETIRDLLAPGAGHSEAHKIIHENGSTTITGVTTEVVTSVEQANALVKKAASARKVEATQMNAHSSRSHTIFILHVSGEHAASGSTLSGALNLVDLAGSERVARSGASGDRLKEACAINKSLSSLGDVFAALGSKAKHVPYRNSKLTYLLAPCLGGDGKTLMFVNVSPDDDSSEETSCSLKFAAQVNAVELGKGGAKRNVQSGMNATKKEEENGDDADNEKKSKKRSSGEDDAAELKKKSSKAARKA
jgi:kinesin family protein C1